MNPAELRMMWQFNPEDAPTFFTTTAAAQGFMAQQQQAMEMNPMMTMVSGDFSSQAAALQAASTLQPTLFAPTNATAGNDIFGLAQIGDLQQQLLQQTAANMALQNFKDMISGGTGNMVGDDDDNGNNDNEMKSVDVYGQQIDDAVYGDDDGISGITPKQEIINIDDYVVMMNDSNSYDGSDYMNTGDIGLGSSNDKLLVPAGSVDDEQLVPLKGVKNEASTSRGSGVTTGNRSQRKTRKIEPVNRPGLVLKTPIAYKGNIDPSVIPIQKDGMAVCERCGAIGVKHTFYTKSRRFCSMSCARGELYSLVVNGKMSGNNNEQQQIPDPNGVAAMQTDSEAVQDPDVELELQATQIKNTNFCFRLTDDPLAKVTQEDLNNFGNNTGASGLTIDSSGTTSAGNDVSLQLLPQSKGLRMYHDVLPQDELPQIPRLERLPPSCPQLEKIISIRRRQHDPTHSYDWSQRLKSANFFAAPVTCFPHAPGYDIWDSLGIDMKVEVENTDCDNLEVIQPGQTPHSFWVATIQNICGYKALMRYEGFDDDSHDFWVNLCNAEVHSVGWCAMRGKPLIPPRSIENKYKDWKDFLVERLSGARTLPSSFYNKVNDSMQSRFRLGLNLEIVDKERISQVRLATITKIVGKRLYLRYFDIDDGFWCHEDSQIIHPVGWATTVGHNLAAPQDYLERMLAGRENAIEVHEDDATIELFKMNFTFDEYYGKTNGFVEGMKLEAVDPLNLSSICAATVMAVLKFGYMMIRIDTYPTEETGSDWFCYHEKSPSIFPVGFCAANNIALTPPHGYSAETFSWETYLQATGSVAAGAHLFQRIIPNHGFQVGMSLECADLMDPRLVCVATVSRIVGRLLKIHFDGWTEDYDQWLDCESPDIYPVGWCILVNHKLEGPPVPQVAPAVKTTPKSRGQKKRKKRISPTKPVDSSSNVKSRTIPLKTGPYVPKLSIKLDLKPEHQNPAFYEHNQSDEENENDDELDNNDNDDNTTTSNTSFRSSQSTPISAPSANLMMDTSPTTSNHSSTESQSKTQKQLKQQQQQQQQQQIQQSTQQRNNSSTVKRKSSNNNNSKNSAPSIAPPTAGRKATSYIGNSAVSSSKYIPRLSDVPPVDSSSNIAITQQQNEEILPDTWNVYDVSQFLRVNDCTAYCDTFSRKKIDGRGLLELSKDDIITMLGMKVGPALKIFDLILQLKCKMNPSKSRLHKTGKSFL